jgi:hypothetical protein
MTMVSNITQLGGSGNYVLGGTEDDRSTNLASKQYFLAFS